MAWLRRLLSRKWVRVGLGAYAVLWVLTATWGVRDVDRAFDELFSVGYADFSDERVPIERIPKLYVRDVNDPRNDELIPESARFRYRSRGLPVAPFIIIDDIGTVYADLGGIGARRANFWFFGYTKWWVLETYWQV